MVDVIELVFVAEFDPAFLVLVGEVLEILDGVVGRDVVLLEVLHQHEDEQVQHDKLDHDDENDEKGDTPFYFKPLLLPSQALSKHPVSVPRVVSNMILGQSSPVDILNSVMKLNSKLVKMVYS